MVKIDWFALRWYVIVFTVMGVIAYLSGRLIEGVVLFIAFHFIRYSFPKTFHHENFYGCIIVSIATFWLAIPRVIAMQYSIFGSILIAVMVAWYAYKYQDKQDKYEERIAELTRLLCECRGKTKKDPRTLDDAELYDYCRSMGLGDDYCKIANIHYIQGLKGRNFYDAIGYSERQSIRIREKIQEILE
jgi:hypothetical protein